MRERVSINTAMEAFFRARPNAWVDGRVLGEFFGVYGWRTRCSDLRKRGLTIENRQRRVGQLVISEYRYVPAEAPAASNGHDVNAWGLR